MTDQKKPTPSIEAFDRRCDTIPETPQALAHSIRIESRSLIETPQLPPAFIERIQASDFVDTEGKDRKTEALAMCTNINLLFRLISQIPELSESARAITEQLRTMTGDPLHQQIKEMMVRVEGAMKVVTDRVVHPETGADYLLDTRDGEGTPRVDMEKALRIMASGAEMKTALVTQLGLKGFVKESQDSALKEMGKLKKTEYAIWIQRQRAMEEVINQALERNEINEVTAQLVLKAVTTQMIIASNSLAGQRLLDLSSRIDKDDLGYNEAERIDYLLATYWQLLGGMQGFRFLKKFFPEE